jgi:hypothetical protein
MGTMINHTDRPTLAEAEEDDRVCGKPVVSDEVRDAIAALFAEVYPAQPLTELPF